MAENKKSFVLYADLIHTVKKLPIEKAGELFLLILGYVNDENPVTDDLLLQIAFEPIKQQLKRDLRDWEQKKDHRSATGVLGNLKRWHLDLYKKVIDKELTLEESVRIANDRIGSVRIAKDRKGSHRIAKIANVAVNVNDNVNVTVIDSSDLPTVNHVEPNGSPGMDAEPVNLKKEYSLLIEKFQTDKTTESQIWIGIRDFIKEHKPDFIEPYVEAWNIIAGRYGLAKVQTISSPRKRKFGIRISEDHFDFIKILGIISKSDFLKGKDADWKCTFDWVFENEKNYVKILEMTYQ